MRPTLTPEQAAVYSRDAVLGYTGVAGADRADPWDPRPLDVTRMVPDIVVGAGQVHHTVQDAVNAAIGLVGRKQRVVIGVDAGTHDGLVYVPDLPVAITLVGLGRKPQDTVLTGCIDAEMTGGEYARRFGPILAKAPDPVARIFNRIAARDTITTANASVLRVENTGFQLLNLTVRNSYNADRPQAGSQERNSAGQFRTGQHQAVALLVAGADRVQVQDVVLRSYQDTLYLQSPRKGETVRTALSGCDIEGDVDFIFGQSTAWFENCTIRSLGTRAAQTWATAPSTDIRTRFGFVFNDCDFVHDGSPQALAGRFSLGRQWFEGVRATPFGTPSVAGYSCVPAEVSAYDPPTGTISPATLNSVGKCVILESRIGAHINADAPWDPWSGRDWSPRHRPALYTAGDMMFHLSDWLEQHGITYGDIDPAMVFLAEYNSTRA